jgi:hypothetical protein
LVAFSRDPALAIWQAMKPLAEVGARTDAPDIAKIVTEAEIILFGLVRAFISTTTKYGIDSRHSRLAHRANYALTV